MRYCYRFETIITFKGSATPQTGNLLLLLCDFACEMWICAFQWVCWQHYINKHKEVIARRTKVALGGKENRRMRWIACGSNCREGRHLQLFFSKKNSRLSVRYKNHSLEQVVFCRFRSTDTSLSLLFLRRAVERSDCRRFVATQHGCKEVKTSKKLRLRFVCHSNQIVICPPTSFLFVFAFSIAMNYPSTPPPPLCVIVSCSVFASDSEMSSEVEDNTAWAMQLEVQYKAHQWSKMLVFTMISPLD